MQRNGTFLLALFGLPLAFANSPVNYQMLFQDPASPLMRGLIELHHDICFFLLIIICLVG